MENLDFKVNIDFELKSVDIFFGVYDVYGYSFQNANEIGGIVQSFVNEYLKKCNN